MLIIVLSSDMKDGRRRYYVYDIVGIGRQIRCLIN